MGYALENQAMVDIYVGESRTPLPISADTLIELTITQNTHLRTPTMKLVWRDMTGFQSSSARLSDGVELAVKIGSSTSDAQEMSFRIGGAPSNKPMGNGKLIEAHGYLSLPKLFHGRATKSFDETSSGVLSRLAKSFGLAPQVASTNDKQVWLPDNKDLATWMRKVANRGWANDKSGMLMAITENAGGNPPWALRYLDVTAQMKAKAKGTFFNVEYAGRDKGKSWWVEDYRVVDRSGSFNRAAGYSMRSVVQTLDGGSAIYEKMEVPRFSKFLDMNEEVKKQVGNIRRVIWGIDTGNTHKNFVKAFHQNKRNAATFSKDLNVLTPMTTGLALLDKVDSNMIDAGSHERDVMACGDHIIGAKAMTVRGSFYREHLELCGQGPSEDPGGSRV